MGKDNYMENATVAVSGNKTGPKKASKEFNVRCHRRTERPREREREDPKRKKPAMTSHTQHNKKMTKQKKIKQTKREKGGPSCAHVRDCHSEDGASTKGLCCNGTFGQSVRGQGWVCCATCKNWVYEQCVGIDDDEGQVICCLCQRGFFFHVQLEMMIKERFMCMGYADWVCFFLLSSI